MCLVAGIVALVFGFDAAHLRASRFGGQPRQMLESVEESASYLPRLKSLVVSHKGQIVLERYFNGARAAQAANIKSA